MAVSSVIVKALLVVALGWSVGGNFVCPGSLFDSNEIDHVEQREFDWKAEAGGQWKADSLSWQNIRIKVLFHKDVTSSVKDLVNQVASFYQDLLKVVPAKEILVPVTRRSGSFAVNIFYKADFPTFKSELKLDSRQGGVDLYKTTGADYVLFVSVCDNCYVVGVGKVCTPTDRILAMAAPIVMGKRYAAGLSMICAPSIRKQSNEALVNILKHEFLHAFGGVMQSMAQRASYCSLPWQQASGKSFDKYAYILTDKGGYPRTAAVAKKHFDCDTLPGAPLEDAPSPGSFGVHWEESIFGNEIFTPLLEKDEKAYFSEVTATFLEELQLEGNLLYKVNRDVIQDDIDEYWYGKSMGCTFAMRSCHEYVNWAEESIADKPFSSFPYCAASEGKQTASTCLASEQKDDLYCTGTDYTPMMHGCSLVKQIGRPVLLKKAARGNDLRCSADEAPTPTSPPQPSPVCCHPLRVLTHLAKSYKASSRACAAQRPHATHTHGASAVAPPPLPHTLSLLLPLAALSRVGFSG